MIVYLLILHFVADFLFQSREMGKKKSEEPIWLIRHLFIQWFTFLIGLAFVVGPVGAIVFAAVNAIVHGVIDWNIWRLYKLSVKKRLIKNGRENVEYSSSAEYDMATGGSEEEFLRIAGRNWKYWEDHYFYTTIGFDQLLHSATLVLLAGALL